MNAEGIARIEALTEKSMELKTVGGDEFSPVQLHRVYSDPRAAAVVVKSLGGILCYLENNIDKLEMENLICHVVDHKTVNVITNIHGASNERNIVISAQLDGLKEFPFERYIDQELFIIKLRSMFGPTADQESILKYTAKIDKEATVRTEDDGITQNINVKQGLTGVRTERENIPAIVKLCPYRTFSESEQPASEFLFRMKTENSNVECALFEADGGAWRDLARHYIAAYFIAENIGIPVIV